MDFIIKILICGSLFVAVSCNKQNRQLEYEGTGEYFWNLIYSIDNSNNSATVSRSVFHEISKSLSYTQYKTDLAKWSLTTLNKLVGTAFDVLRSTIEGASAVPGLENAYDLIVTEKREDSDVWVRNETWTVEPNQILKLYRLVFKGPGVIYETEKLYEERMDLPKARMSVQVRQHYFLKDFNVVYMNSDSRPGSVLDMAKGDNPNINEWNKGKFVYLVPMWTTNENESATGLGLSIQIQKDPSRKNIVEGSGEEYYRYLDLQRDYRKSERIIEVALYKDNQLINADRAMEAGGWSHWSPNIMEYRPTGLPTYIVWKTKPVVHAAKNLC